MYMHPYTCANMRARAEAWWLHRTQHLLNMCVCVCVRVCARARARVCVCVCEKRHVSLKNDTHNLTLHDLKYQEKHTLFKRDIHSRPLPHCATTNTDVFQKETHIFQYRQTQSPFSALCHGKYGCMSKRDVYRSKDRYAVAFFRTVLRQISQKRRRHVSIKKDILSPTSYRQKRR